MTLQCQLFDVIPDPNEDRRGEICQTPTPPGPYCRPHLSASTPVKRPLLLLMTSTRGSTFPSVCISKPLSYPEEATVCGAPFQPVHVRLYPIALNTSTIARVYLLEASDVSQKRHGPIAT
jgi:hypothetical protein